MKTYQPTQKEIVRKWHLVNAKDEVLGRIASKIAGFLMGKNKATYSAHMDSGDFVVVTNSEKVVLTGEKREQKVYRGHSGYPGGFKEVTCEKMSKEHPERIIQHAVSGMLPDNRLKQDRIARLKIFKGEQHSYEDRFNK